MYILSQNGAVYDTTKLCRMIKTLFSEKHNDAGVLHAQMQNILKILYEEYFRTNDPTVLTLAELVKDFDSALKGCQAV